MKEISIIDLSFYVDNTQHLNIKIEDKKIKSSELLTPDKNISELLKETLLKNGYKLKENDEDTVYVISFYAYGDNEIANVQNKHSYLQENKSYLIKNPVDVIVKSILKNWEDKKKNNVIDKKDISKIVGGKQQMCLYTKPMNEVKDDKIVEPKEFIYEDGSTAYENELSILKISDNEIKVNYTANWGQKSVTHYYKIDTLNRDNIIYIPVETQKEKKHINFILVDGIYSDYKTAKKVLTKHNSKDKDQIILIKDNVNVVRQEWYKNIFKKK